MRNSLDAIKSIRALYNIGLRDAMQIRNEIYYQLNKDLSEHHLTHEQIEQALISVLITVENRFKMLKLENRQVTAENDNKE